MKSDEHNTPKSASNKGERQREASSRAIENPVTDSFARTLLDMAIQVEQEESRIKRAVLQALEEGNVVQVKAIVKRWLEKPVSEVLGTCVEGGEAKR